MYRKGKPGTPALHHGERFPHPQMEMLVSWVRAGAGACECASEGTPASSFLAGILPWGLVAPWCHCLGDPEQGHGILPLQVEAGGGERRGRRGREGRGDRCPDRWTWPPALPSLMNFPPGPAAGQSARPGGIWDDSRMRRINQPGNVVLPRTWRQAARPRAGWERRAPEALQRPAFP